MAPSKLNTLTTNPAIGYVMPSAPVNIAQEEKELENILKDKVGSFRKNEHNLATSWDSQLSYLLSTALSNYEYERIGKF